MRKTKSIQIQEQKKAPYVRPSIRRDYYNMPQVAFATMLSMVNSQLKMKSFLKYYNISIDRTKIRNMSELTDYLCKIVYGDEAKTIDQINQESMEIMNKILAGKLSRNGSTSE